MRFRFKFILCLLLILLLAAGWKLWLLSRDVFPFNSDEAVVALMARHILGGELPTFFYGQAYMGSLDAYLVAAGFAIFGQTVWVIRFVQVILYLLTIITTVAIGDVAFKSPESGLLAGLFLALPPVNSMLYTTVSLGGYGEALLIGSLDLLVGFIILNRLKSYPEPGRKGSVLFLIWGFLTGAGLWANGLTFVFSAPMGLALLWSIFKQPGRWTSGLKKGWTVIPGFLLGSLPWWLFAIQNGLPVLIAELFGSAVAVEQEFWLVRVLNHGLNFLALGLPAAIGIRPPWEVRWLAVPLIPFVLVFFGTVFIYSLRLILRTKMEDLTYPVMGGIFLVFTFVFLITPFGVDPSGRYFLPLSIPFSLVAARFIYSAVNKKSLQIACIGLVLVFNGWGTLDCAARTPPGLTTQFNPITVIDQHYIPDLISFLRENGETRGYTNYWVAYPLAFLSGEDLLFVPQLPYQTDLRYTERDDRYLPYDQMVQASPQTAYITTRNQALDEKLRTSFLQLGITWQEKQIGDFQIFYHLSKSIRPNELNLGT